MLLEEAVPGPADAGTGLVQLASFTSPHGLPANLLRTGAAIGRIKLIGTCNHPGVFVVGQPGRHRRRQQR